MLIKHFVINRTDVFIEKKSQTETRQRQYGLNHSTLLLILLSVSLSLCSMQFKLVPTHFDARLKIISQFTCTIIMRTWVNAIYISHINISQAHDRNGWEHKAMRAKAWALLKFERNISIICWNGLPLRMWGNTLCKSHGGMRFESIVFFLVDQHNQTQSTWKCQKSPELISRKQLKCI